MLAAMGWILAVQLIYFRRSFLSKRWPKANAKISRSFVGQAVGPGGRASFFTYKFVVQGASYEGRFMIMSGEESVQRLQDKLNGQDISVRYNPNEPTVSFIADALDARFEGHAMRQNPYWYYGASAATRIEDLNLRP
jgi:hypothetical protein